MMNHERFSEILAAYRPGEGLESDPEVREALAQADRDPALGTLLKESLEFDDAFSAKLKEAPVPDGLYERILARVESDSVGQSALPVNKQSKLIRFFHPAAFAAAAAIILLLALSFTFWNPPGPRHLPVPELQTAAVAPLLESANALYSRLNPSFVSHNGQDIIAYLKTRNGEVPASMPGNVSWGHAFACDVIEIDGKSVSIVCFKGQDENQTFHLFSFRKEDFERLVIPQNPIIITGSGPCSATWEKDNLIHVLYSNGGEKNLRQLLDI